jgi:hypothetical protein
MPMRWCSGGRGHGWTIASLRSITGGGGHGIHCSAVNRHQKVATPATPRPGGGVVMGSIPLQRFWTSGHPYHPYLLKTEETKREGAGRDTGAGGIAGIKSL